MLREDGPHSRTTASHPTRPFFMIMKAACEPP